MLFNDLGKQWEEIRHVCLQKVDELGYDGGYIGGKRVEEFEVQFASYIGTKEAVGVSNGTDALKIAMQALDLNAWDTVIMPANTFIADYIAVKHLPQKNKPKVVLIDNQEDYTINVKDLEEWLKIYRSQVGKVVLIAVHLYGHSCDMEKIMELKDRYDLILIEDCSQSHGTKFNGQMTGTFGDIAAFSLYPGKNLGALGDAGILTTDNPDLAKKMRALRNYGSSKKYFYDYLGHNNRLDPIQCIFLSEKLKSLDEWNLRKREIAQDYIALINSSKAKVPKVDPRCEHSFHIFCLQVENREEFMTKMSERGIPTIIHYPYPIHKTALWDYGLDKVWSSKNAEDYSSKIVSIPIHPYLTTEEFKLIIDTINAS